jgi:quinol-cytochrome oxidoreductase complex cytochrome b subunit
MFAFQALKLLPPHIVFIEGELFGIILFGTGGLIWMLVPYLSRKSDKSRRTKAVTAFGYLVVIFIVAMTIIGYLVE